MKYLIALAVVVLSATTADAGPLRNALSRLRVRVATVVRGPAHAHCAAPKAAPVKAVVAAVARAGGAIIPCPGGQCPVPAAK